MIMLVLLFFFFFNLSRLPPRAFISIEIANREKDSPKEIGTRCFASSSGFKSRRGVS